MALPEVRTSIAAGRRHSIGVAAGGFVVTVRRPGSDEVRTVGWSDVVAVAAGNLYTAPNTGRSTR